jgi:hypothetical protein
MLPFMQRLSVKKPRPFVFNPRQFFCRAVFKVSLLGNLPVKPTGALRQIL